LARNCPDTGHSAAKVGFDSVGQDPGNEDVIGQLALIHQPYLDIDGVFVDQLLIEQVTTTDKEDEKAAKHQDCFRVDRGISHWTALEVLNR